MRRPSLETDRQRRFSASSNSAASTRGSRRSSTTDDGVATRRRPSLDNKSLKLSTCARVAPPESTTPAPKAARFGDDVATAAPSANERLRHRRVQHRKSRARRRRLPCAVRL